MLHDAIDAEDLARVRSLLEQGADIHELDEEGSTPLHAAATLQTSDIARLLLDYGADIYAGSNYNMTPLKMAAWHEREQVIRLLLERGAARNQTDLQSAMRMAILGHGYNVTPILQEYGARIGLIEAMYMCDTEAVYRFLEAEVDVEQRDDGDTLLMHAVIATLDHPYHNFVPLILERGADVNAPSEDGMTPLMAAKWGKEEVVRQLLAHGADPNLKTPDGQAALDFALQSPISNAEAIEILRQTISPPEGATA